MNDPHLSCTQGPAEGLAFGLVLAVLGSASVSSTCPKGMWLDPASPQYQDRPELQLVEALLNAPFLVNLSAGSTEPLL